MSEETKGVRAVIIPVDEPAREIRLARDEEGEIYPALCDAVDGGFEHFDVLEKDLDGAVLYINGEGTYSCPPNRAVYATEAMARTGYLSQLDYRTAVEPDDLYTVLHGDIVAVGYDPETGEHVSLTDEQAGKVTDYFTRVSPPGTGPIAVAVLRVQEQERVPVDSAPVILGTLALRPEPVAGTDLEGR